MWLIVALTAVLLHGLVGHTGQQVSAAVVTSLEAGRLRDEVREMFYHSYNGYMEHAFPLDELRPLTCTGEDSLGGYSLTLVDALDMLALLGDRDTFTEAVTWLGQNLQFKKNKTVSVFETTIRVLGGLLSAHLIASDSATGLKIDSYNDELLHLAEDLGHRLLPAFDTPTGIPYGSVNLLFGVSDNESQVTSTAGGGTLTLEFGVLSRLTRNPVFERVSRNAVRGLWAQRSNLGLVGAHINVFTGEWTHKDSGIGTSIDSFYEYLFKAYILLGNEEYLYMFNEAYKAVMKFIFNDPWYLEVNMNSAVVVWPLFNSLQAFWPGLQVLFGDIEPAVRTHRAFFSVWKKFGFTPEGFNLATFTIQPGQKSYPLRPELIESTYMLYKATKNPRYLRVGREILRSIQKGARCPCGFCHIADVETHEQDDHMESFFLSETMKYLWLLFDLAAGGENLIEKGPYTYVFTTEGHFLPLTPVLAFSSENCDSDARSSKESLEDHLYDDRCEGPSSRAWYEVGISKFQQGICNLDERMHSAEAVHYSRPIQGVCSKPTWKQLTADLDLTYGHLRKSKPRMQQKEQRGATTELTSSVSTLLHGHCSPFRVHVDLSTINDMFQKHRELAQKGELTFIKFAIDGGTSTESVHQSDTTCSDETKHALSRGDPSVKESEDNHPFSEENDVSVSTRE